MAPSRPNPSRKTTDIYFLDANVLMYAAGSAHPLREPCRRALQSAVEHRVALVTDSEVLQEILYRYFSIRRPEVAKAVYGAATRVCEEVLPVAESHTARALELLLERPQLSHRDAIHLATMESKGIQRLLSTDREFDGIERIQRVDPADFPA